MGTELGHVLAKFGDTYNQITMNKSKFPNVTVKGKTIKPFYKIKIKGEINKTSQSQENIELNQEEADILKE